MKYAIALVLLIMATGEPHWFGHQSLMYRESRLDKLVRDIQGEWYAKKHTY